MPQAPLPSDREESIEKTDLRALVSEYDELFELCGVTRLDPEEVKKLDELYATLLIMEEERWLEGSPASAMVVETIRDQTDIDFPMIRFELGLLSGQNYS